MICFQCDEAARGICSTCGVALCKDHGHLVTGEESLPTENSLQRAIVPVRSFVCEFDQERVLPTS